MLVHLRSRAKKKHQKFNLTIDDIPIPEKCPIFGIPLKFNHTPQNDSPSCDRIDNKRGYEKGNVVVICHLANSIKRNSTLKQLQQLAKFYTKLNHHNKRKS